jgi:hypothetical protein
MQKKANLQLSNSQFQLLLLLALVASAPSSWSANSATIKNKVLAVISKDNQQDAAVTVRKIGAKELPPDQAAVEATPGEQRLEVECLSRTFVGMGTMDIAKTVQMTVKLEPGKTYQLGARLTKRGDCMPTME